MLLYDFVDVIFLCCFPRAILAHIHAFVYFQSLLEHQKNPKKPMQKHFQNSLVMPFHLFQLLLASFQFLLIFLFNYATPVGSFRTSSKCYHRFLMTRDNVFRCISCKAEFDFGGNFFEQLTRYLRNYLEGKRRMALVCLLSLKLTHWFVIAWYVMS